MTCRVNEFEKKLWRIEFRGIRYEVRAMTYMEALEIVIRLAQ